MTVGLVVVSHSAEVASGVRELAAQMAPAVQISAAGGADGGGLGTSLELIQSALQQADEGDGLVVLYDLGSALLTTEMALELAEPDEAERWLIVDAPLVEGAIAAAVEAQGGGSLDSVAAAARSAGSAFAPSTEPTEPSAEPDAEEVQREVEIVNPLGLHARPAASLAGLVADLGARVSVSVRGSAPVDLRSVMSVVSLATRRGDVVRLAAKGVRAAQALDRIAAAILDGFGERDDPQALPAAEDTGDDEAGAPGSPGLAVGPLVRLGELPRDVPGDAGTAAEDPEAQLTRAVDAAARELERGDELAQAHAAIVPDPDLLAAALDRSSDGVARAWWSAVLTRADELAESPDELVAARAVDVREAGAAVLERMGVSVSRVTGGVRDAIVLATEIGPTEAAALLEHGCAGVVLTAGSPTAHAVVVTRGLGIPMVIQAGASLADSADGTVVAIDGSTGAIEVDPPAERLADLRRRAQAEADEADDLRKKAAKPVRYQGDSVLVAANVGSVADARAAVANGADAVGLLRTELLVLDRDPYPDEDEQTDDLRAVLEILGDRPVVVRALDAGGDKPVRTLDVGPEHNGFLGVRGLRYLLQHPDLLRTQLRAIARAAVGHSVSVMAPMVTTPDEARAFRDHVEEALESLRADGVEHAAPTAVGIMIEVPLAALAVPDFAGVVDFISVGSNDLLSYLAAADRTEADVAHLLDTGSPALARVLDLLTADADAIGVPVAVCGELAGDDAQTAGLLARGVRELSMSPARIPLVKQAIRDLT